ncbi:hypothetical protein V8E53_013108, partial [Lactarius tabidus]
MFPLSLTCSQLAEKDATFALIQNATTAGILNLTKWYCRLNTCHVYTVSNVFDPAIKLAYIKKNWGPDFMQHIKTIMATILSLLLFTLTGKDIRAAVAPSSQP